MSLTNLQKLRLAVADRTKIKVNETIGVGDDSRKQWRLEMRPIKADSEAITIDDVATSAYTLDDDTGLIVFTTAPTDTHVIKALIYSFYAFSDDELNDILDAENNAILMSAARCLRILAGEAARFFVWISGNEKVDKSKICANFLKVADSWEKRARSIPASEAKHWKLELEDFGDITYKLDTSEYLDL